jgi:hypothetical protein
LSRDVTRDGDSMTPVLSRSITHTGNDIDAQVNARLGIGQALPISTSIGGNNDDIADADKRSEIRIADDFSAEEEALAAMEDAPLPRPIKDVPVQKRKTPEDSLADGIAAALNKLRKT